MSDITDSLKDGFKQIRVQTLEHVIELTRAQLPGCSDPRPLLKLMDDMRAMIRQTESMR